MKKVIKTVTVDDAECNEKGNCNYKKGSDLSGYYYFTCNKCGHKRIDVSMPKSYHYCPNCGRKIDGVI